MAIDRPIIQDDSGDLESGTVADAAWVDDLMDRIDAAIDGADADVRPVSLGGTGLSSLGSALQVLRVNGAGTALEYASAAGGTFTEQSTSNTGTQNNFNLSARKTYLRCTGAAPSFTGFTVLGAAPQAGDEILIDCLGTTVKVENQAAGSTAANRIITPSSNGQIVGANGRMHLVYDDTTDRWREALVDPGSPIDITFSAGLFTASAGNWTVASGDVTFHKYVQCGKKLTLYLTVITSTVSSTPNTLRYALPAGFTGVSGTQYANLAPGYDNNVFTSVVPNITTSDSNSVVRFNRADFGNWSVATDLTYVYIPGHTFIVD